MKLMIWLLIKEMKKTHLLFPIGFCADFVLLSLDIAALAADAKRTDL